MLTWGIRIKINGSRQNDNEQRKRQYYHKTVIATGGSAIYGKEAMEHLCSIGQVVYLKLSYEILCDRIGDLTARGVSIKEGQSFEELMKEREPLYEKYAKITVDADDLSIREVVHLLKDIINI